MPVRRIRLVDVRDMIGKAGGRIKKSIEFKSSLANMREKNIGPHEVVEIEMPKEWKGGKTTAANFASKLNNAAKAEDLPYTALAREGKVLILNNSDL